MTSNNNGENGKASGSDRSRIEKGKTLELDRSRIARAFSEGESLWEDEIIRMSTLLKDHIKFNEDNENEPSLLSIGLFGSPGSGKSSLLRTFVDRVRDNKLPKKIKEQMGGKIFSLEVIKPNQQSGDDHFLYTFLARALEADRKSHEDQHDSYRNSSILSVVQQKFQEVSEYLQVVNNSESRQGKEDDPLGASLDRLERHESDLQLIERMKEFIDALAETLGNASVILLPVDDADFSLNILTTALETCWRYLQHSKLVPIFTFTGRLAEELLRVQFEKSLNFKDSKDERSILKESSTPLLITETMAMQYMSKLFPVRNRIRMGQASARVLEACYKSMKTDGEKKVRELVKNVSQLLFGYSNPLIPEIRAPLRMVTLRRQFQIVDALQDAYVDGLVNAQKEFNRKQEEVNGGAKENKKDAVKKVSEKSWKPWGKAFDFATWTLLNTHRDVLREIQLNLDDLYSWTPQGLRMVLLNSVLALDTPKRWELLNHWRYRSEERRSQVISLMAANVFRPRMRGEEKTGDDQDFLSKEKDMDDDTQDNTVQLDKMILDCSFRVGKAASWFLRLCIGFYLPQYLVVEVKKLSEDSKDFVSGAGWGLITGPVHAIREAVNHKKIYSTGMVVLEPRTFSGVLQKFNPSESLLMHLWCFYGYEGKRPWAAVSLWRGLGLLGRLLESYLTFMGEKEEFRKKIVEEHLKRHLQETMVVMSHTPEEGMANDGETFNDVTFKELECLDMKEAGCFSDLVTEILAWLDDFRPADTDKSNRIFPLDAGVHDDNQWSWDRCFVRRIHGESIISIFFKSLDKIYVKDYPGNDTKWNAGEVIERWCLQIGGYWEGCIGNVGELFLKCPILLPFLDDGKLISLGISKSKIKSLKKSKSVFSKLIIQGKQRGHQKRGEG